MHRSRSEEGGRWTVQLGGRTVCVTSSIGEWVVRVGTGVLGNPEAVGVLAVTVEAVNVRGIAMGVGASSPLRLILSAKLL